MMFDQHVHIVRYRGYVIEIKKNNDWRFDEALPGNLLHHLLSLR